MRNTSKMEIDKATLIEALQLYFDTKVFARTCRQEVADVKEDRNNGYGAPTYSVELKRAEDAAEEEKQ